MNNGTITGVSGTGGSQYSYQWNNTGGFVSDSSYTNGAGTYQVQIKDNVTGCIYGQNFTIPNSGAPSAPTVTASATSVCVGGTTILTAPTVSGVTYNWTEANGSIGTGDSYTVTNIPNSPNPYTIGVTASSSGCAGAATTISITVNAIPPPPVLTAPTGTNNSYCQGSPTPLTASSGTTNIVPVWYSNNIVVNVGPTFTPPANLPAGTYTFSVIDSLAIPGGCVNASQLANTVTLTLVVNPLPSPPTFTGTTGPNNSYCQGMPTPLTVNSGTSTAVWYSNNVVINVGPTYTPPVNLPAGTYTFSIIDSVAITGGCVNASQAANTLTLTLVVNPLPTPPIFTGSTTASNTYCQGSPTPLTVNSGTAPSTAVWYSNNTVIYVGSSYTPPANLPTGTYTYSVIDSAAVPGGCISGSQSANTVTLSVTINPTPTLNVSGTSLDSATCGQINGGVTGITLGSITGGTPGYTYQWYNITTGQPIAGATSLTLSGQPAGNYSLQVTDANLCIASVSGGPPTFTVPAVTQPVASASTTPSPATGSVPFNVVFTNLSTSTSVSPPTVYVWMFGDGSGGVAFDTSHTYTSVGTYTAMLVAITGSCRDTFPMTIIAETPTTLVIPNIFTPNGDGTNDVFYIINTGMASLNCDIFNRWGQLLHTITAPNQGWDGIVPNGDKAPDGTYMYILQAQGLDGKTYKQEGTVTLIR